MVVLIPPYFYAALYYPRSVYLVCMLIAHGATVGTIFTTNTVLSNSLITLSFVFCIQFIVLEVVFRNACSQRKLIKENIEINARLEESNHQLKETFDKLIRVSEMLPICQVCNKLRTDEKTWNAFEVFLHNELHTDLVKGICEDCTNELVTELSITEDPVEIDLAERF
jgi:hypothetical protein